MPTSPRAILASQALGVPVGEFIADRRAGGKSFRAIALEMRDVTDGAVDVTDMTVRAWLAQAEADAAATAAAAS